MKILFFLCLLVVCGFKIILADVKTQIKEYFDCDNFLTLRRQWQTERQSFENALTLILAQNFGHKAMNVYVKKVEDFCKISDGFYFTDNIVDVVLNDMHLQELPKMVAPDVKFALASNFIQVEAGLQKMIINTNYSQFRNQSTIVFAGPEQDPYKKSPFSFYQVQTSGELTIVADDCVLTGYAITSLSGYTVNLGLDTFKVTNCTFSIEIYSAGLGSPPVMGPYFSKEQSITLETMLTKPLQSELKSKLQAAVFSYVNTSAILGDKLNEIQASQKKVFKAISAYMTEFVKTFTKRTISQNQGALQLKPMEVSWTAKFSNLNETCWSSTNLKDMVLYGLDTAYSAHSGGPYKLQIANVAETIRFSTMQVRGKICLENVTLRVEHDFAVELKDVGVNVEMEANTYSSTLVPTKTEFIGWRALEFSILDLKIVVQSRKFLKSIITGYLISEIPKRLVKQLSKAFGDGGVKILSGDNPFEKHSDDKETLKGINAQNMASNDYVNYLFNQPVEFTDKGSSGLDNEVK